MFSLHSKLGIVVLVAVAFLLVIAVATAWQMRWQRMPLSAFAPAGPAPTRHADLGKPNATLRVVALSDGELAQRAITKTRLGELEVESGAIVAADPLVQPERPAFARKVAPGRYPVTLYRAQGRVALAELRLAPGEPARWQMALVPGQDATRLKPGEVFGYPVDAGLGAFMDVEAQEAYFEREKAEQARLGPRYGNAYDDILKEPLSANGDTALMFKPLADEAANIAIFQSGWGDGFYASYWGLDRDGNPLVLVTDFEVLRNGGGHESPGGPPAPKAP